MFPNRYLPSGEADEVTYIGVSEVAPQKLQMPGTSATLLPPDGARVGDFAFFIYKVDSTKIAETNCPEMIADIEAANWNRLSTVVSGSSYTNWGRFTDDARLQNTWAWWKFLEASDLTNGVRYIESDSTTSHECTAIMPVFRNVHPTCPMMTHTEQRVSESSANDRPWVLGLPMEFHDRRNKAIIFASSTYLDFGLYTTEGPTPVASFTTTPLSLTGAWIGYGVYAPDLAQESYNLCTGDVYGYPDAAWQTYSGTIINQYDSSNGYPHWEFSQTLSTNDRHYAYREFEFEAGQDYMIMVSCYSATNLYTPFVSVHDGTDEYGVTSELYYPIAYNSDIYNVSGTEPFPFHGGLLQSPGAGNYPSGFLLRFTPTRTGTHQLRLGLLYNGYDISNATWTSASAKALTVTNVQVSKGSGIPAVFDHAKAKTDAYPFLMNGQVIAKGHYNANSVFGYELVHKNCTIPADKINIHSIPHITSSYIFDNDEEGLSFATNALYFLTSNFGSKYFSNSDEALRSYVPLYPPSVDPSAPAKAYFEYTITGQLYTVGFSSYGFSIGPFGTWCGSIIGTQYNGTIGHRGDNTYGDIFAIKASGTAYVNAVSTTSFTSLANGDIVGCAVDRDAGTVEFYKNGTLIADGVLTNTNVLLDICVVMKAGAGEKTFEINLTGPFTHKPTGYTAWDWRNAV